MTSFSTHRTYSREEALHILDTVLLPKEEYGTRIGYGRDAQGIGREAVGGDDPRLALTYGEFPTHSMDQLLDCALQHMSSQTGRHNRISMIDLGSGCGRLVLYAALTRESWSVSGIEISDILHNQAQEATNRGVQAGLFQTTPNRDAPFCQLLLGPAEICQDVLSAADIIFAYSTVWQTNGFSEELGAMIMDRSWSGLLAGSCRKGCVVVTTDRALDPREGWQLLDRMDVDNREVFGSTGFIQVLR